LSPKLTGDFKMTAAVVRTNIQSGFATLDLRSQKGVDKLIIQFPPRGLSAPSKSLASRVAHGLYQHSGKIALFASALMIASQTEEGPRLLNSASSAISEFLSSDQVQQQYQAAKQRVVETGTYILNAALEKLPEINLATSAYWAIPNIWNAGSKKAKATWLLAGTVSAALPYALQPGFSWNGAWEKAMAVGSGVLAQITSFNKSEL
jgi:hypothetical protein